MASPCHAVEPVQALHWLNGRWRGDGTDIAIDSQRLQANDDPTKPFQWDRFAIRNVAGCMLVFDIGVTRYFGMLYANGELHLTSGRIPKERILRPDQAAPRRPCPQVPPISPAASQVSTAPQWGGPR